MITFKDKFEAYIKSACPLIQINSSEYDRVIQEIARILMSGKYSFPLYVFSHPVGLIQIPLDTDDISSVNGKLINGTAEITGALRYLLRESSGGIFVFKNLDIYLHDQFRKALFIDFLFAIYEVGIRNNIYLINISQQAVPNEISNYFVSIDYSLPNERELYEIVTEFLSVQKVKVDGEKVTRAVGLLKGLSRAEVENALALSISLKNTLDFEILRQEKALVVRKTGLIEWIEDVPHIDEVGGLENLKAWFRRVAYAMKHIDKAIEYGLKIPKGCLLFGIPGTGKTLSAKAIASLLELPLFRLDLAKMYNSLVGETEKNIRTALQVIDALSPCVVLVDEVEKAVAGFRGDGDSGVSARLFGTLLYYMQEKKSQSFFVCTANDITRLPPEFLRKGRFDEIWFVDLPTSIERTYIWDIHLKKTGRVFNQSDLDKLANLTEGFTGSEIESVINETLYRTFFEGREPTLKDFFKTIKNTTPLSVYNKGAVEELRLWAEKSQVKKANSVETQEVEKSRLSRRILN